MTDAQFFVARKSPGEIEALTLSEDPLTLQSERIGTVQLELGHQFRVVQDQDGWHVSTTAYRYHLSNEAGRELIAWHWHPGTGDGRPHIHVPADPIDRHVHVPTGRISIESVFRMLLTDLRMRPRREDYQQVLDDAEELFNQNRSWP